jgi:hypothetical protein
VQFGGVDSFKPNPLAGDDEGIPINDRRRAGDVGERRPCESGEEQGKDGGTEHQKVLCGGAGGRRDQRMPQR